MIVTSISARWVRKMPREVNQGFLQGFTEIELGSSATLEEGDDYDRSLDILLTSLKDKIADNLKSAKTPDPKTVQERSTKRETEAREKIASGVEKNPPKKEKPKEKAEKKKEEVKEEVKEESKTEEKQMTALDLKSFCVKLHLEKVLTIKDMTAKLNELGYNRTEDVPDDKVLEVKAAIEALIK